MQIPDFVLNIVEKINNHNFEVFLVGGCVRDLLMGGSPKDWDLTTDARPAEMLKFFPDAKYENDFGTVLLPLKNNKGETENVIEITTYRSEKGYSDRRHPDEVFFEKDLDKDLERRDFTINALALGYVKDAKNLRVKSVEELNLDVPKNWSLVDLFGGEKDIKKKVIRAVGEPGDRFKEDALRMIRAIRFSSQLNFEIEAKTERNIAKLSGSIKFVAKERIKDELIKILKSDLAYEGFILMYKTGLLRYIIPELYLGENMKQNHHHIYTVLKHSFLSLKYCPSKLWQVRLASFLHDIGKPKSRAMKNGAATFYNHEYIGERLVRKIMQRLKFSSADTERVTNLVRNHMFYYNAEEVTASSVRRLIQKVGRENLKDLMDVRIADRLGSGTPKAKPYKLRHLEYMMEKVQNDPVSVKMLKINGDELIKILDIKPGPKIGAILDVLLSEVIEDPKYNNKEYLETRSRELNEMDLEVLRKKAKEAIAEKQEGDDQKIKKEHWVK